jgi:hypothetical protein|nr:MAG TPA: hypothetical protein [Caudoviricetes sp.]
MELEEIVDLIENPQEGSIGEELIGFNFNLLKSFLNKDFIFSNFTKNLKNTEEIKEQLVTSINMYLINEVFDCDMETINELWDNYYSPEFLAEEVIKYLDEETTTLTLENIINCYINGIALE